MIKHIILWKIKEEFTEEEKGAIRENAKRELEALMGKIDGLVKMSVEIRPLSSSNADLMLDSVLRDAEALASYQKNPLHIAVADTFVRPFMCQRLCLDCPKDEQ